MNSRQFRSWLAKQGCTFEVRGAAPVTSWCGVATPSPNCRCNKQLGTGLINKIKKDLGLR